MSRLIPSGTSEGVDSGNVDDIDPPLNVAGEFNIAGTANLKPIEGISGTVVDLDGNPIQGATVSLFLQDGGTAVETTTTNAAGEYGFSDHPDAENQEQTWHLVASKDSGNIKFQSKSLFGVEATFGEVLVGTFDAQMDFTSRPNVGVGVFDAAQTFDGVGIEPPPAIYGDGSDGDVVQTTATLSGDILQTDNFTINSGETVTVEGTYIVHATDTITIDGELQAVATNSGGSGAGGGAGSGSPGQDGPDGEYVEGDGLGGDGGNSGNGENGFDGNFASGAGGGGRGAFGFGSSGGDGGDGGTALSTIPSETTVSSIGTGAFLQNEDGWSDLYALPNDVGAGGGGGGAGGDGEQSFDINTPGGDGGRGAGMILLIAPNIEGSGTVSCPGENGSDGDEPLGSGGSQAGGGGGGGGGCGGLLYLISENAVASSLTTDVSGGTGGAGGFADSSGHNGGDGADGRDGTITTVNVT